MTDRFIDFADDPSSDTGAFVSMLNCDIARSVEHEPRYIVTIHEPGNTLAVHHTDAAGLVRLANWITKNVPR